MVGGQDSADGARAQPVPQPEEFALDASMTPGWILLRQAQHQATDLIVEGRATGPVRVGPLPGNQAAVPCQQCAGGDDPMKAQLAGE